jgi:hypothetical protein
MLQREGRLLRIFVAEQDKHEGQPLYEWLLHKAREERLAGCTVLRGMAGFGADSHEHTSKILRLSADLPVVVEIIDAAERIEHFLPFVDEAVEDGLVTVEHVDVRFYRSGPKGPGN